MTDESTATGEFQTSRTFTGVGPERLFEAYLSPAQVTEFIAPAGLSVLADSVVIEPHVGGRFEFTMVMDESGVELPNAGVFTEFDPPHRLAFFEPAVGLTSTHTFSSADGGAEMIVHQTDVPAQYLVPEVEPAFQSSFDKLQALIDRERSTSSTGE
jgi:hypothetical protein